MQNAQPTEEVFYQGARTYHGADVVRVDLNKSDPLRWRLDLQNHSPTGFEWSYGGSGPSQLALALLADATGNDESALRFYQDFKWDVVARLPYEGWRLPLSEVKEWVQLQEGGVAGEWQDTNSEVKEVL